MKTSRLAQETILNFNAEEDMAELYTANPVIYRRMVKRGFKAEKIDDSSWIFEIPKKAVRLPVLPRKPLVLSRERKLAMSDAFKRRFHRNSG